MTRLLVLALASLRPCASFVVPSPLGGGGGGGGVRSESRLFVDGQGTAAGTTRHLVGDVLRSLQPRYLSQVAEAVRGNVKGMAEIDRDALDGVVDSLGVDGNGNAPSWEALSSRLSSSQTAAERRFRTDLEEGSGPPSSLADLRLFGEEKPRLVLYRDSASWCPYCQKVWIALEERRVPYEVRRVDMRCYGTGKPQEFMAIQDSGNLPVAVIDDGKTVIGESDDILAAVDAMGDGGGRTSTPRLFPEGGTEEFEFMRSMCDDGRNSLERRLYTRWMYYLTGVRKPEEYRRLYEEHLDEVEEALSTYSGGPYFLGKDVSIIDVKFAPFLERQEASLAYFSGFTLRDAGRWPNLVRWLEAMEGRDSYLATKSDWYTHSRALPPQLAADCATATSAEAKEMRGRIDSGPVGPSDSPFAEWVEPGWANSRISPQDEAARRREAAERLVYNRENIVRFACRGAGLPGLPASAAPLADPRCTPNDGAVRAVDLMVRHVADGLLSKAGSGGSGGGTTASARNPAVADAADALASVDDDGAAAGAVADCLDYLRARIGVPRDMSYPAARGLRAELRDAAEELRKAAAAGKGAEGRSAEKSEAMVPST